MALSGETLGSLFGAQNSAGFINPMATVLGDVHTNAQAVSAIIPAENLGVGWTAQMRDDLANAIGAVTTASGGNLNEMSGFTGGLAFMNGNPTYDAHTTAMIAEMSDNITLARSYGSAAAQLGDKIPSCTAAVKKFFGPLLKEAQELWDDVKSFLNDIRELILQGIEFIRDVINTVVEKLLEYLAKAINFIRDSINEGVRMAKDLLDYVMAQILPGSFEDGCLKEVVEAVVSPDTLQILSNLPIPA